MDAQDTKSDGDKARRRSTPRLFLVTPASADAGFADKLKAVIEAGTVASVLVWGDAHEGDLYAKRAKALVPVIQAAGAAAVVRGDIALVEATSADGFHSDADQSALEKAFKTLQPDYIVGAAHLRTTHEAMSAGEAGADYVFFGNLHAPDDPANEIELLLERAAWWQNLFVLPCVFVANDMSHAVSLANAGADFVALHEALWLEKDPSSIVQNLQAEFTKIIMAAA